MIGGIVAVTMVGCGVRTCVMMRLGLDGGVNHIDREMMG
jgi:hypothetical protein